MGAGRKAVLRIPRNGFSLVELLLVVAILGIIAAVVLPQLSSSEPQKLTVAAEETANTLRFAFSEAERTGGYVLVDGKSASGHLKAFYSTDKGESPPDAGTSALIDPLTKRAIDLFPGATPFAQGVTLTPQFRAGGQVWSQILIGPGLSQIQGYDGKNNSKGLLQANSGVVLALGSKSLTVAISETSGLVTLP